MPKQQNAFESDLIIAGGGLAAIFTGYELLKNARRLGKNLDVLILAERINTPCSAGSHTVLEVEGMFNRPHARQNKLGRLLRTGLELMEKTLSDEQINCRYKKGYEIKGKTREELENLVNAMTLRGVYQRGEIKFNSIVQDFYLPGHEYSLSLKDIGQINMPEMIDGLILAFKKMGGRIISGTSYIGQHLIKGGYSVETNHGEFKTRQKPLIATGACHQKNMLDFNFNADVVYTMCVVLGPLSDQDAETISKNPIAICNTDFQGDVLWGGMDEKKFLTLGRGDLVNPSEEDFLNLRKDIFEQIDALYPGILDKYEPEVSFGPMLIPENKMPIVGRMKDYDIAGGWAGMGIVAGYTAAHAYARWIVEGRDDELKIFEDLQPGHFFTPY